MKSLLVATTAAVLLTLGAMTAAASSSTTPASGGTNVSADLAQNGVAPAFATIVGVINDVTNFGSLSLASGALRLHVVLPGQSFADGSTVASSGISGVAASQAAGVSFNLVELVAADRQFNVDLTYSGAKTVA